MATKLSNSHLTKIMLDSKNYYVLDTYIILSHVSSEIKGKFLVQSYSSKKSELVNIVKKYTSISYKTIYNNIHELIELGILSYNDDLSSWVLVGMENMVQSKSMATLEEKDNFKGYTTIRDFFLSTDFTRMKAIEKRCLVYLAQLKDSKASASYSEFKMNLNKSRNSWMKILKTSCKYYAKYAIETLLNKYEYLFVNTSKDYRAISNPSKSFNGFLFSFTCDAIKKIDKQDEQYNLLSVHNKSELNLVEERIAFAKINLSKINIVHIVRSISTISDWRLKEEVVNIIINKYIAIQIHKSRESIKSLPAYLVAVVKDVITRDKDFKAHCSRTFGVIAKQIEYSADKINNINTYSSSLIKSIEELVALV